MRPPQPPATNPSSELYCCINLARSNCRRRHHDARQRHPPARVLLRSSGAESPLRHAAETAVINGAEETPLLLLSPPNQHLLRNDAPTRENDTEGTVIVRSGIPRSRVSPGTSRSG
ncbi:hypothetical protein VPH35_062317 [Triticum aestivum]|uniref:Uncharacterized protein n=1 Tax=Aegilops tauschii subsp. strangulata TaxID=200361 RepID=A0A453GBC8_AEGTS